MENLNKDLFRVVGKSIDKMDSISRPNLSFLAGCLEKTEEEPGGFHRMYVLLFCMDCWQFSLRCTASTAIHRWMQT